MIWRALVPIKPSGNRKTRLARCLSPVERARLTDAMLCHVLDVLQQTEVIAETVLLGGQPLDRWSGHRIPDGGRGLNAELSRAARAIGYPLLVIHADLPLLSCDDVIALLAAAEGGVAIAPDRHGLGTNALASTSNFTFSFGRDSLARHMTAAGSAMPVIQRDGLMMDVDEAEDLEAVARVMQAMQFQSEIANIIRSAAELALSD